MKKILLISAFTIFANIATSAQNVNIPDVNFKAALVGNPYINTNGDGEIQVSEAAAYAGAIDVFSNSISDLTGIGAFTALTSLNCYNNLLTSLNVSANMALTYLRCSYNQLTSLNVSANAAFTILDCGNNQITNLNVSANTALILLHCSYNLLTSLNISANTSLADLDCSYNQLTSLNMQNSINSNFAYFNATNNTGLFCIQVNNIAYMNTQWSNAKDSWASYSTNCSVGITDYALSNTVAAYPNPTAGTINFSDYYNVRLTDIAGSVILEKQAVNTLDISNQPAGMYFILLTNNKGQTQQSRVIKE